MARQGPEKRKHPRGPLHLARKAVSGFRAPLLLVAAAVVAFGGAMAVGGADDNAPTDQPSDQPSAFGEDFRAFSPGSWWNSPLPDRTPLHPRGEEILHHLRTGPESGRGCLKLAGADNDWGHPIYWSEPSDPTYDVRGDGRRHPPELNNLRIPSTARPADNSDRHMSVYDLHKGYVVALTGAHYDRRSDTWYASGATVTYLDSNGLHVATGRSDDPRNQGTHRGNNGAVMAVSWDQVKSGEIRHVLKIAAGPEVSNRYIFPMVGSDGDYTGDDPAVPPQGLRMRLKASIDLDELDLNAEAHVIAEAIQRYGVYIGDSGGTTALKLENTAAEGRGRLWTVGANDLCGLPFTPEYWEVVAEDYGA